MKKILIAALIAAGVSGQAFAANSATSGTIKFTGKVVAQTCTIKGDDTYEQTVTLPTVAANQLPSVDATAGATPFSITLTGCAVKDSSTTKVYANFATQPQANVNTDGRLNNTASSNPAANVDIALYQQDGSSAIDLNQVASSRAAAVDLPESNGDDVTLNYVAKYYATGAATSGPVASSVEFELAYQ